MAQDLDQWWKGLGKDLEEDIEAFLSVQPALLSVQSLVQPKGQR